MSPSAYLQPCDAWGDFVKMRKANGGAGLGYGVKMPYRQPWLRMFRSIHYVEAGAKDEEICCGETNES